MRSTHTHKRKCKSRACNLITASGKQAMDSDKQTVGAASPQDNLEFKLSSSSGGIQTLPSQYCFKVSKPHLSKIVSRYPNPTFPKLFQGIQTLPFQYSFKVSKPCLSNIVSRYPNPAFPKLFQGIQTSPFQYSFKVSKPHLSNIVSRYPNPTFPIKVSRYWNLPFSIYSLGIQGWVSERGGVWYMSSGGAGIGSDDGDW